MSTRIAIIAALDRELRALVRSWPSRKIQHDGREFILREGGYATVICGGIGSEATRRAAEAIIVECSPELLISAGIAGALVPELHVGETLFPAIVVDVQDGSRHETAVRHAPLKTTPLARTVIVSFPGIVGPDQKRQLAKAYVAHAVDMEAAAVAHAAQVHSIPFLAVKAISDELDFELPQMGRFVREGRFETRRFLLHVAFRPWMWLQVFRLARNTRIASENLCAWLRESVLTHTIVPSGFDH